MSSYPSAVMQNQGRQPDPTEIVGNALKLKQAMAMAPEQLKAAQLENQQRGQAVQQGQLDLDSQKALHRAFVEANGDYEKAIPLAAQYGAKPDALMKMKQASLQTQQENLKLIQAKGDRAIQEANLMQGAHDAVTAAKPEDRPQVYQQALQGLQQAQVDVSHLPQQYPGDDAMKTFGAVLKGHTQGLEEVAKVAGIKKTGADTDEATAKANEANAQANKLKMESQYGPTGPAAEARYRFVLSKLAAKQPVSQQDLDFARGFEASNAKNTTTSDSLGVTSANASRPAGLSTVGARTPAAVSPGPTPAVQGGTNVPRGTSTKDSLIDAFGQYKADPAMLSRMMMKHPGIIGAITQKYPDWRQTDYNAANKLVIGMTSGSQSKEINAINTAMGHLKNLDDAVDALHNGNATALNKIGTYYNINLGGKTAEAAFKLIAEKVGSEVAGAYIPGGGGVQERVANREDFDVNLPPQTLHNNAAVTVEMLRSKIGSLENQYKNTVGRDDFSKRFISPAAQAALDKFSQKGAGGAPAAGMTRVRASDGSLHDIPTANINKARQRDPGLQVQK